MTFFAELTVTALLVPLTIMPPGLAPLSMMAPEAAAAAPPVAVVQTAPVAVVPVAAAPTVVAPAGTTVVVSDGAAPTVVAAWPADTVATTTTTTTTTATTTTMVVAAPPAAAAASPSVLSPKAAVTNLLKYDPYLAPRYRSGRNMMIGGGVMLGVGTVTVLSSLAWLSMSNEAVNQAVSPEEKHHLAQQREQWLPTARIVGLVGAAVVVTSAVLLATGAVRRRRAIEEARGRVYMQAGPGGVQVRF